MSLTESTLEAHIITLLQTQGYHHHKGTDLDRPSYEDVLLEAPLRAALTRLNPGIPTTAHDEVLRQLRQLAQDDYLAANEQFYKMLIEGIAVEVVRPEDRREERLYLIDFHDPARNDFWVVDQFTVRQDRRNRRPDLVLFVNGLPLVVIELKNPADAHTDVHAGFQQLRTYKSQIPALFCYNGLLVVSDGLEARMGSLSAGWSRFGAWRTEDGRTEADPLVGQLETLTRGLLRPAVLLDVVRYFTVFERSNAVDAATGQIRVETVKKIAAYHQYYAVNKAVRSTLRASGYAPALPAADATGTLLAAEAPAHYGLPSVEQQTRGDRRGGVVWHTQGSGKSLSMVFYTAKMVQQLDNPTVVVITDRNDLDDQLFGTFAGCAGLLRNQPQQMDSRADLRAQLNRASGGILFTTIHKFSLQDKNTSGEHPTLSERDNIIVIADEAHRTQYGFDGRVVEHRADGQTVGVKTVYGFAKYLRDALPNATYIGFTGTPVEQTDRSTPEIFGHYIDVYDIARAVEDGATVPIYYESRLAKVNLSAEGRRMIERLDEELDAADLSEQQQQRARAVQLEALVGSDERLKNIAADVVQHFEKRLEANGGAGKGMIVAMSRRIAARLYQEIIALRPDWHDSDLTKGILKVVMTTNASDGPEISAHKTTKTDRRRLAARMRDPDDPLRLVIVRDMWLTGFDAPSMHTLYLDKPMRGHNLMQAIARVNRVFPGKTGGLVVDYLGIAADLKRALSFYADAGGKGDAAVDKEQAVNVFLEKLDVIDGMFHGYDYAAYATADVSRKLRIILGAEDHVLGLERGKKRFLDGVTALSQAYALASPHPTVDARREEVAFFQAVRARLVKFDERSPVRSDTGMETAIRQTVNDALISDAVVDIYDAAGIQPPEISILSDEFLAELRGMEHKNVALELLKRLLQDEITARMRTNLVGGRSLLEQLDGALNRYHNKILTAVEVIDELIAMSKRIVAQDAEAERLGLSDYELGFYHAVASNDSARDLMGKEKLRALAVVLFERVRTNATIDWTIKENVRAKLRVLVKRTLRRYGYPPDMQELATDTVLAQAELLAGALHNDERRIK